MTVLTIKTIIIEDVILEHNDNSDFLQSCEVGFEGIKMTMKQKGNKPDRVILDGSLKGKARPGRMLAVMGPSGSGKSSLIHALAGRIKQNKKLTLSGQRYVNNQKLSGDSMLPAAFIEQDVNFFPHMTVKETLDFRVELKLGSQISKSDRDDVVSNLMDLLGLTKSSNTIVGSTKVRGLSGGERKRLSIACELISSPPVIILDEPTSGLDSYQAAQVTEFLRKLADSGKTIISVIHQPSQQVFSMYDDLLLISEGHLMYYGEVNKVRSYLQNIGYSCSKDTGTAEFILDCISRTNGGADEQKKSTDRINHIAAEASRQLKVSFPTGALVSADSAREHKLKLVQSRMGPAAGILRQFKLLLTRALKEVSRGKGAIIIKVVQQVTLGGIYGGIYKVGNNQASIMDRFGLLSLVAIGSMNMAVASTIRSFTKEKAIVSSEMAGDMYRTLPYFLAKAISEIPLVGVYNVIFSSILYPLAGLQKRKDKFKNFIGLTSLHTLVCESAGLIVGAISPNSDVALSLFPALVVLNIIFDGRNISAENTPKLLRWIPKVSLIRWGFEGLAVNEFNGLEFNTSGPRRGPLVKTGKEALDRFGMADRKLGEVVAAQRNILGACWFLSYLGLSLTGQKYETMVTP